MASSNAARLPSESVWRDRAFVPFWLAQTVSGMGTAVTSVVLPILIFRQTGSPLQTAILGGLRVVPYLLFGLVAGALADRVDRRRLMVGCNLLNTALLGSIPLAAWLGLLTLPQIYLVALLSATAFVLFDAANFGALPALVGPARIVAANSALWSTSTFVGIAGPALGGVLATTIGPAPAVTLDALSYAVSAAPLLLIARPFNAARVVVTESGSPARRILALNLLFLVGLALAPTFGLGLVALLLWDTSYTLVVINGISLRQRVTPEHLQSRVNATARMIAWGGTPFGAAAGGVLAQVSTVRVAYLAMAAVVALTLLVRWFSPLRRPESTTVSGGRDERAGTTRHGSHEGD